jgi:hypothetical protein
LLGQKITSREENMYDDDRPKKSRFTKRQIYLSIVMALLLGYRIYMTEGSDARELRNAAGKIKWDSMIEFIMSSASHEPAKAKAPEVQNIVDRGANLSFFLSVNKGPFLRLGLDAHLKLDEMQKIAAKLKGSCLGPKAAAAGGGPCLNTIRMDSVIGQEMAACPQQTRNIPTLPGVLISSIAKDYYLTCLSPDACKKLDGEFSLELVNSKSPPNARILGEIFDVIWLKELCPKGRVNPTRPYQIDNVYLTAN